VTKAVVAMAVVVVVAVTKVMAHFPPIRMTTIMIYLGLKVKAKSNFVSTLVEVLAFYQ